MTPALSILCAVLVVVIVSLVVHLRGVASRSLAHQRQLAAVYKENSLHWKEIDRLAALVAEAHALLHDTAARGKDARWLPWSERRAAWVKKCEVRG